MNRQEQLAEQARERAEAYRREAEKKKEIPDTKAAPCVPGTGCGATQEEWPDGACCGGYWGKR